MNDQRRLAKKSLNSSKMVVFTREQEIIVYFDSWNEFSAAVEQLCIAEPNHEVSLCYEISPL